MDSILKNLSTGEEYVVKEPQGLVHGGPMLLIADKPGARTMAEANALVNGDRQADYGTPRENYAGVAKIFSGILSQKLKADITPEEAALLMVGLKLQRQAMKHKHDNLVDAHGYLLVYEHIQEDGKCGGGSSSQSG